MKFLKFGAVVAGAVLGLAACGGGSVCDDISSGAKNYNDKASACSDEPTFQGLDSSTCDAALNGCTDADKTALSNYFNCLGSVDACSPDNEAAFDDAVAACGSNLANVSQACGLGG